MDNLGKLIVSGVAGMLAFQTFVNVGVATGLLPNTGMPFPFLSYGGSSMWINMISIGLVLNVGMRKPKSIFEG
jgi:rod shape determining protein RodA